MAKYEKYKDSGVEWIGQIPEDWTLSRIKYHFNVVAGATPSSSNEKFWDGNIPWITPADYKTSNVIVRHGARYITKEGYESCSTTMVPEGSIIFSKRAPIGSVAVAANVLCTNQGCLSCIPKENSNSKFYYYLMSVIQEQFELEGSGTTFKEISASSFSNFVIPSPAIKTQECIASFLDTECSKIDSLIATQQKRVELLKELRQSVITKAVTKGLNPDAKMKDSGVEWIGEVPGHWDIKRIKYTASDEPNSFMDGDWIESSDISTSGIRYLTSGNVGAGIYKEQGSGFVTEETFLKLGCKEVFPGDILFSRLNLPSARSCMVPDLGYRIVTCVDNVIYRPSCEQINKDYIVFLTNSQRFAEFASNEARGSTMQRITRNMLGSFKVILPPLYEQDAIVSRIKSTIGPLDGQIETALKRIELLKEYKQSLITEVVTGKRKVC